MLMAVEDEVLLAQGIDHVEYRLEVLVFDDRGHGRFACGFQAVGADGEDHLADVFDLAVGQQTGRRRPPGRYPAGRVRPRLVIAMATPGMA